MTRPIYEPSLQRTDARLNFGSNQLFRRPAPPSEGGCPCFTSFRAAMGSIADPETDRVHYPSGDGGDAVYWDQWDTIFDATVFDTGPYEQTINGIPVIGGVGLLKVGVYSIHAQIDLNDYFNGVTLINSNFDEGQAVYSEHVNVAPGADLYLGDYYNIRLDHWRQVVEIPPPDQLWGGEATDVQIVFAQNNDANLVFYSDADPGVGSTPTPGSDVWIPGGYDGAWGYVPNMLVVYWGPTDGDPDWPGSFPK